MEDFIMALVNCPECGRENVSDSAETCPNCGYPVKKYFQEVKEKQQEEILQKQIDESKKKFLALIKNKKIQIPIIALIILVLVMVFFYKESHVEVIHGVRWGMGLAEVEDKESKYSGSSGYYDEDNGYYAISNVDYLGESVTLMYIFEDEKLASIWIAPTYDSYKNVYNMALEICKEDGLPVSFEDNTDDEYAPRSTLTWNIKGTTIDLIGNYASKYSTEYYFSLKPYDGKEFGKKYEEKGICKVGSALSWGGCKNEITPWCEVSKDGGYCYEHGCYVIGCPNGFANVHDQESLCLEHHFLCE